MTSLYNCKHSGDQYKITKFDSDFNVEASYLCDLHSCECPAGHRPKCRHREMLPKFIARDAVGTEWFWDHDRGGWVQGWKEEPAQIEPELTGDNFIDAIFGEPDFASAALLDQPHPEPTIVHEIILLANASPDDVAEAFSNLLASEALPIQPEPEPSPNNQELRLAQNETSIREEIAKALEPSPSPTIRRRV